MHDLCSRKYVSFTEFLIAKIIRVKFREIDFISFIIIFQAPSLEESVDYHFVAFVEKDGTLYDLDGRKPGPLNCGKTTKETFLKVTFIS